MSLFVEGTIKVKNKLRMSRIGFDTSLGLDKHEETKDAVLAAIDAGYLIFYCDSLGANLKAVGQALNERMNAKQITRDDIVVAVRIYWHSGDKEGYVEKSLRSSLRDLNLDYIDLLIFHCPISTGTNTIDYTKTWKQMEACSLSGLTRGIGVSNFNEEKLTRLLKKAEIKPVINLVECNVFVNQKRVREYCRKKKIIIMALNPFGPLDMSTVKHSGRESPEKSRLNQSSLVKITAGKYKRTISQIALRYLIELEVIPVPKSRSKQNIILNYDVFDFKFNDKEMKILNSIDDGTYNPVEHKIHYYKEDYAYFTPLF